MTLALASRRTALTPPWVRDSLWRRARAVPSLDLRFADNKSLVDAVTGASLVTFTRASNGTFVDSAGVLQTASTDVPRFDHNPITGESLGLLVEEQRVNLSLQSNQFDTTWTNGSSSETAAAGTAPDGTNTAWELKDTLDVSSVAHLISQNISFTSGVTYTFSAWLKQGTLSEGGFTLGAGAFGSIVFCRVNLATGAVISSSAGFTTTVQAFSNGWYRVAFSGTATVTASTAIGIRTMNGGASYQGDGTGTILIYGAQLEAGAFPTSYIPTTTAAVTRNADVASITGSAFSGWYSQSQGTVFAEGAVAQPTSGGNQFVFRANDNSFNNNTTLNIQGLGFASIATAAGGVFDGTAASPLALSANTTAKFAGAYAADNLGISLNGATAVTDTSATMPTALNRLDIGSDHIGANRVKAGTIRRLTFWGQRLPNNVLQGITQ